MKKLFRFESMWLKDQRCEKVVKSAWEEGQATWSEYVLGNCLEKCQARLEAWNKTNFGHVGRQVVELQKRLEWLEIQPSNLDIAQSMRETRIELNCWLEKEDEMWRQRSRLKWFKEGDKNRISSMPKLQPGIKRTLSKG